MLKLHEITSLKPFSSTQTLILDNISVPGSEKKTYGEPKIGRKGGFGVIFQVKSTILRF